MTTFRLVAAGTVLCGLMSVEPTVAVERSPFGDDGLTLVFTDDFDRDEPTPGKEAIGNGWTTNSAWRAAGKQQVDLVDGAMHVTRAPEADHGVAIFHDVKLRDGVVELRFQLGDQDDLGVDFVDRELKTVHAGHLCVARVTTRRVTLTDSKTGGMDLKIRERRQNGDKSPELAELLKSKQRSIPHQTAADTWHTLRVEIKGDVMTAAIDGKEVGELQSPGIAHPTKRMITLGVNKQAKVDDVRIWKRD
ncbi:MAG: family 16 glycoside hydrolase [Planctomycetaceae bacterium]